MCRIRAWLSATITKTLLREKFSQNSEIICKRIATFDAARVSAAAIPALLLKAAAGQSISNTLLLFWSGCTKLLSLNETNLPATRELYCRNRISSRFMEILEGKQCVLPALLARQRRFQLLLVKQGTPLPRIREVIAAAESQSVPIKYVAAAELESLTKGRSHGGLAILCTPKPVMPVSELLARSRHFTEPAFFVLIEGTEDAQNLGYTLRTAEALGAHAVFLKKHVWNFDGVAVARASSGAFERLPLVQIENIEKELTPLRRLGVKFWGSLATAKRAMYEVDLTGPIMLAIGGERRGLSRGLRDFCDGFVRIPTVGGATSLALSHAASIVMAEARRQRHRALAAVASPQEPAPAA